MTESTEGTKDMPAELEDKLDAITATGQEAEPQESHNTSGTFHDPQLGGIAKTGEGPDDLQAGGGGGGSPG